MTKSKPKSKTADEPTPDLPALAEQVIEAAEDCAFALELLDARGGVPADLAAHVSDALLAVRAELERIDGELDQATPRPVVRREPGPTLHRPGAAGTQPDGAAAAPKG